MFILRIIEKTRKSADKPFATIIENFELGDAYSVIPNNSDEYSTIGSEELPDFDLSKGTALICGSNEKAIYVIEKDDDNNEFQYYIMSDSGKTFERLN